ncbi:unnamed protein product [Phytomonas sp. Hart1]|nr:unnamed protein product [Phytomonas sp. Hart1]|eukprot:CCW67036.1 unnamed protein product [Phytomonas sp. isolate Hart1]
MYSRRASHSAPGGCGWYDSSPESLKQRVGGLLDAAKASPGFAMAGEGVLHGLIAPHAGIIYSGLTASVAYRALYEYLYRPGNPTTRLFIVGPSHHAMLDGVAVSRARAYETPFGPLPVDTAAAVAVLGAFAKAGVPADWTTQAVDEGEHSIEMQMPFLSYLLHFPLAPATAAAVDGLRIVPIIAGWADRALEGKIADALEDFVRDPCNVFILSSDFCHWGRRFRYTFHYEREHYPAIGDAIIAMDHQGMDLLHNKDLDGWYHYLDQTNNTICGRRPIGIGLNAWVKTLKSKKLAIDFVSYSQSNKCQNEQDSSVSYAAALIHS